MAFSGISDSIDELSELATGQSKSFRHAITSESVSSSAGRDFPTPQPTSARVRRRTRVPAPGETTQQKRAKKLWESAKKRYGKLYALASDSPSLEQAKRLIEAEQMRREPGLVYYSSKWPNVPWNEAPVDYDEATKAHQSLSEKLLRARARQDPGKVAQLAEALDEAERKFVAAQLNPANKEKDAARRKENTKRKQMSTDAARRRQQSRVEDLQPSTSAKASMSFIDSATPGTAAEEATLPRFAPDHDFHPPSFALSPGSPGSPSIAALIADPTAPHLPW